MCSERNIYPGRGNYIGPIYKNRTEVLMQYTLIEIPIGDDEEAKQFKKDVETVKNVKKYQNNFHGTDQALYGTEGQTYSWGSKNKETLTARPWTKELKRAAEYLTKKTGQEIDYVMLSRYLEKGDYQPWHQDLTNQRRPTQLIDVIVGRKRNLRVKFIETSYDFNVELKEDCIYIFTHLFNEKYKHKYYHDIDEECFSLTFRMKK